jgi:WD40 repeat protein
MKFSADGSYIGVISHDSLLYVWYVDGNKKFSHNIFYNKLNTNQIFKFTKEDNIIAITKEHGAVLFNLDGKILQEFDKHNAGTNAVDVTDDDKFIAIASSDKTINIWYYNTIEKRYDLYNKVDWHKDTVWSASFSSQNYNIISASADSQIMVGNINKELQLTVKGKNPYCYAKFTPGDRGFSTIDYIKNGDNITYTFYGIDSRNPDAYSVIRNKFSIPLKQESGPLEQGLPGFSYLGFSSKDNYLICGTKNEYFLVDNRQLFEYGRLHDFTLLQLEGIKPFFMEDEKNLITIMGKNLRQYFIDAPEIYRITNPSGK